MTKSTVPVGTARKVKAVIQEELDKRGADISFDVASNPEFLKEGAAIKDFMSPDRVVVGIESKKAEEVMTKLYQPFLLQNFRVIFMDIPSAEMTKYAANAMLATRISFMNDIANLCERVGVNDRQKSIVYDKLTRLMGDVKGKTIAMLGLAFKPDTDDMREAPALVVIDKLLKDGAIVRVFDPIAMLECKRRIGEVVTYTENLYDCADGADALLLMTEWRQFRLPTWNVIQKVMTDKYIVDGRNIWNRAELEELGFSYTRIGEK